MGLIILAMFQKNPKKQSEETSTGYKQIGKKMMKKVHSCINYLKRSSLNS